MWRWRDWVIDAFNQNMPFDQFALSRSPATCCPSATLGQKLATGFNRNHRGNVEGGTIPEEYRRRIRRRSREDHLHGVAWGSR